MPSIRSATTRATRGARFMRAAGRKRPCARSIGSCRAKGCACNQRSIDVTRAWQQLTMQLGFPEQPPGDARAATLGMLLACRMKALLSMLRPFARRGGRVAGAGGCRVARAVARARPGRRRVACNRAARRNGTRLARRGRGGRRVLAGRPDGRAASDAPGRRRSRRPLAQAPRRSSATPAARLVRAGRQRSRRASRRPDVRALHQLVAHAPADVTQLIVVPCAALACLLYLNPALLAFALVPLVAGAALFRWMRSARFVPAVASRNAALEQLMGDYAQLAQNPALVRRYPGAGIEAAALASTGRFEQAFSAWVGRVGSWCVHAGAARHAVPARVGRVRRDVAHGRPLAGRRTVRVRAADLGGGRAGARPRCRRIARARAAAYASMRCSHCRSCLNLPLAPRRCRAMRRSSCAACVSTSTARRSCATSTRRSRPARPPRSWDRQARARARC